MAYRTPSRKTLRHGQKPMATILNTCAYLAFGLLSTSPVAAFGQESKVQEFLVESSLRNADGEQIAASVIHESFEKVSGADKADSPFSVHELRMGKTASREHCEAERNAVWVDHAHGQECIRYYPSEGLENRAGKPPVAVLFFHGDRLSGSTPLGDYEKTTPMSLTQEMQANYKKYGIPFILIARPGVYGSSGDHHERRRPKEFHSLDTAVDAIKRRYGLDRIVIAGQSGGSTVGGALLTLGRKDIACAVLGSGNYDILELAEIKRAKENLKSKRGCDVTNYCDPYNVVDFVNGIATDPDRLIAIVGDPTDNNTVFPLQKKFADSIKAAGHTVQLIEAEGKGPDRHGLAHITYRLAGACALTANSGKPIASIDLAPLARTTAHASPVPPASGYARIDDINAVPVSEKGKLRYAHYLTLPKPKAFVATEKGGWFFHSATEDAMQKALEYCPKGTRCWLYAIDDRVVWREKPEERFGTIEQVDPVVPMEDKTAKSKAN